MDRAKRPGQQGVYATPSARCDSELRASGAALDQVQTILVVLSSTETSPLAFTVKCAC
jgi:hypothetical protein